MPRATTEIRNDMLPETAALEFKELTRGYLNADHAWGAGIDAKYFFHRYFGAGIEGYVLDANGLVVDEHGIGSSLIGKSTRRDRRAIGSVLGIFAFRYPLQRSRFAPYAFAGGGAIFGGGERSFERDHFLGIADPFFSTKHTGSQTEPVGQFGGGVEFRLTPHIGITSDFSWNVVNGRNNNFGMARTGINFAF